MSSNKSLIFLSGIKGTILYWWTSPSYIHCLLHSLMYTYTSEEKSQNTQNTSAPSAASSLYRIWRHSPLCVDFVSFSRIIASHLFDNTSQAVISLPRWQKKVWHAVHHIQSFLSWGCCITGQRCVSCEHIASRVEVLIKKNGWGVRPEILLFDPRLRKQPAVLWA